jgi:hypothetical protein
MNNQFISFATAVLFVFTALSLYSQDEKVDIGIFSGITPDTLIIKARPDYQIPGQSMTNAQLTIKWSEASPITELQWLFTSIGLFPQGSVITAGGFRYQVYASFGGTNLNWASGQEYGVLNLKTNSSTGDCTEFEIAQDDWTLANNGDYYFEVLGEDRTGIRYAPAVNFGSEGGYVDGDTTIYLGNSTGVMNLVAFNGNVLQWERKINQGQWDIMPGTAGLLSWEDTPTLQGTWEYRTKVEKPGCLPQYSEPAMITVELLAVWTGAVNSVWDNPGNWNVVGVPDVTLDGSIPEILTGVYPVIEVDAVCKNLLIDENAILIINPEGTLTLEGFLKNEGSFTMLSDTLSAASFLDSGISGGGTFICGFQLFPNQWHLVSSPVYNSLSGAFEGMFMRWWDETLNEWIPIVSLNDTLTIFNGYLVSTTTLNNIDVSLEGTGIFSGPSQHELTNSGFAGGHAGGFNLLGNPYPSAINWNDTVNWVLDQVDPVIYVFHGEAGNYGTYIMNDPGSSTLGIDSIIGIHQGFFVHVNYNATSGSIALNNNVRLHHHRMISKDILTRSTEPYLKLQVSEAVDSLRDEVVVRFIQGATSDFDKHFDAYDLPGQTNAPQLFTKSTDSLSLAVNSYPPLTLNKIVLMGFIPGKEGNFTLRVEEMLNVGLDTMILLEDLNLDTIYKLNPGITYNFTASGSDDPDRFLLHFQVEPINIDTHEGLTSLNLTVVGNTLELFSEDENFIGSVEIIDPTGRLILKKAISGSYNSVYCPSLQGIYLVRIYGENQYLVRKILFNR